MHCEDLWGRGRPSFRREKLYLVYKILRVAMDDEDVKMLKDKYPGFKERTMASPDNEILDGILSISEVMAEIQTPDMTKAFSLEG